jgi:hypothetical protein
MRDRVKIENSDAFLLRAKAGLFSPNKLYSVTVQESGVKSLLEGFLTGNCPSGLSIAFDFKSFAGEDNKTFKKFTQLLVDNKKCPPFLHLDLASMEISDYSFLSLTQSLLHPNCIKGLSINLRHAQISVHAKAALIRVLVQRPADISFDDYSVVQPEEYYLINSEYISYINVLEPWNISLSIVNNTITGYKIANLRGGYVSGSLDIFVENDFREYTSAIVNIALQRGHIIPLKKEKCHLSVHGVFSGNLLDEIKEKASLHREAYAALAFQHGQKKLNKDVLKMIYSYVYPFTNNEINKFGDAVQQGNTQRDCFANKIYSFFQPADNHSVPLLKKEAKHHRYKRR